MSAKHPPLPPLGAPPLTLATARSMVESGSVRLVTSDVFDTVVWRPVALPHHLFLDLAQRLIDAGDVHDWIEPRSLAMGRIRAEQRARANTFRELGTPECTLEEIWEEMSSDIWADRSISTEERCSIGIRTELATETAALRLHPGMTAVLDTARELGIQIALVSDSYFSIEQLVGLLTSCGLDLSGIDVLTSSSLRCNKWDGLLKQAIESRGGPTGALHFGDNPFADVLVADRLEMAVCHVDVLTEDDSVAPAGEAMIAVSESARSDGARSAIVRETLVAAGDQRNDPSYQFGVGVAGPVMAGFASWVSAQADVAGASAIHCLLREGARIAELIDIVRPEGPPRVLVHASRWAIMRAAVISGSPRELETALARRAEMRADHVSDAFGCDADQVAAVLGGHIIPRDRRADAYAMLAADDALREQIVASSAAMRRRVMTYLNRTLHLDDGPLLLTDIGWGGTIQEGLTAILADAGITPSIIGLYALLSPPGEMRAGEGHRLHSYLPTIGAEGSAAANAATAVRHPEFLERINTPATGTLLDFDDAGQPITRPDDHDNIGPSLQSAQQGVLDFCTTWRTMVGTETRYQADREAEWSTSGPLASGMLAGLAATIKAPDPRLAAELGTWEHDDVAGTGAEALSNEEFRRWIPYSNAVDAGEITMHDVFWVPGVASAGRSALAMQIDALDAGAHPDTLCPPSATGLARVAIFPPDSDLATDQLEVTPRIGTDGWMLIRLHGSSPGVRSIRVDVGDTDLMVDFGDVQITAFTDGDTKMLMNDIAALRRDARWVGGRWVGDRLAAVSAGGHLLFDPSLDTPIEQLSVWIAFRTWPLDEHAAAELLPKWRSSADAIVRRARGKTGQLVSRLQR